MFGPLFDFLTDYFFLRFYRATLRLTGSRTFAILVGGFMAFVLGIILLLGLYFVLKMFLPQQMPTIG